ncbi:MAG: nucleotide exchange factor GrpE, partial [Nostoc sp.]
QSTIEFFRLLERGIETEHNDEIKKVINKNLQEFELIVKKLGFSRIVPSINDKFDSNEHHYKDDKQSDAAEHGSILKCDRWGYRSGAKVLEPAEVILAKKPANSNDLEQVTPLEASTST